MAISYIKTDTDQMNSDVRKLEEDIAQVERSIRELSAELDQLNSMWKGNANQAFRMQVQKDISYLKQIVDGLSNYKENMNDAKNDYIRCENEVIQNVNSIRI